ncbi:MAG: IS200/IS605 family element transposase accessory protein TnpB, partial [Thaumarchaeota archaeon]|nr:IS200/IS605 family element transposase accessory protein TnpB [Nitrososphaerota archaeon]
TTRAPVGIDLGLRSLITTSDGEKVEHPRLLRKAEKRLKHIQRVFSRKEKGSNNWFRARQRVASQHACVRRQRADFNHKLSTRLVREHDFIAFEDLKVRNMVRNHALAKSIHDAGWSQLVKFAEYKASKAGKLIVRVQPAYSTQECFFCGSVNPVELSEREFVCRGCGRTLDRDINAARIVLKRAIARVGRDMPELKPVEMGPLCAQTTGSASPVEEAGTTRATDVRALEAHAL